MVRKKFHLLLVLLVLVISFSSLADQNTQVLCEKTGGSPPDYDCQILSSDPADKYYCDQATKYCFLKEEVVVAPVVNQTVTINDTRPLLTVEEEIENIKTDVKDLRNDLDKTSLTVGSLDNDFSTLNFKLNNLENKLQVDISSVENQQSSFFVGLAGLQQDVDANKLGLEEVEESLSSRQKFTRFLSVLIFILVLVGATGTGMYYKTAKPKLDPKVISFITGRIKSGSKYPQIKAELMRAGWSEKDVKWAYKETTKHNYNKFSKGSTKKVRARPGLKPRRKGVPSVAYDHRKMISITVVSLLLIVGMLLVLKGVSTGKAISFKQLIGGSVNGTSGKITYDVDCTPPHILNPDKDGCCLDVDQSGVCDNIEARNIQKQQGNTCTDNLHCSQGDYCISGKCSPLSSLYNLKSGSKLCQTFYALSVFENSKKRDSFTSCAALSFKQRNRSVVNSICDDSGPTKKKEVICKAKTFENTESYNLKPNLGSYVGAGAIEWKILPAHTHYIEEKAIVPVNVIMKENGKVLSEKVITLKQGEKSQTIVHPNLKCKSIKDAQTVPILSMTLTVDQVFELCS